jgi:uncharacterized protein YigE (DUF2233 family)
MQRSPVKRSAISILATLLAVSVPAPAVEMSVVENAGKRYTVCRVNVRKERLELFHRDEVGRPFNRFERLAASLQSGGRKLLFAMNGGMYHGNFSAVGLSVVEGRELTPLNTAVDEGNFFLKPNGVFLVSDAGARVVETSEYPRLGVRVRIATQSGPLLVHGGRIHPAFRPNSENKLFRNGVGVPSADIAIFVISEAPVNFHEFATLFRDRLGCPNALFLDGTISSLYSPELKRNDFRMDLGPILGVTE